MADRLATYAVTETASRGRKFPEDPHQYRTSFERDRDRIIHSEAFRRLEGKTQVFMPGLDDHYRNRLTHTIEVAQIGRTIAKALGLNQVLTEAICLAHDLGHSPFGHTGEKVLNGLMSEFGGFEHNCQTIRIAELLEHPYPDFAGLNLMYETRLGLAKHRSRYDCPQPQTFDENNCSLEGQTADLADRIAYNCHDLEDAMRSHLIDEGKLSDIKIWSQARDRITAEAIKDPFVRRTRTAKAIIDILVSDLIASSQKAIKTAQISTANDVYNHSGNLITLSPDAEQKLCLLEEFLLNNFYLHDSLRQTSEKVQTWLKKLFDALCDNPEKMPPHYQSFIPTHGLQRTICDYIAGMTDRFCLKTLDHL